MYRKHFFSPLSISHFAFCIFVSLCINPLINLFQFFSFSSYHFPIFPPYQALRVFQYSFDQFCFDFKLKPLQWTLGKFVCSEKFPKFKMDKDQDSSSFLSFYYFLGLLLL
ncbi:unnamed protein product [Coffea canephora]|uniref:Uncharacterized protein n=1 Tax=Coffea canephora TaxID=49390 RepID=A0A068V4S4_COFCA|nr:unnamed protein product [Coffea canephora]